MRPFLPFRALVAEATCVRTGFRYDTPPLEGCCKVAVQQPCGLFILCRSLGPATTRWNRYIFWNRYILRLHGTPQMPGFEEKCNCDKSATNEVGNRKSDRARIPAT